MQAGASMKGEFEQRLRSVIDEVQASPTPIILFIDEIHTLIGAGGQAGTGDAANLLKPALARGTLRTIGATTWNEYRQYIEKDPALTRRFQPVNVDEPSIEKATYMLRGLLEPMEKHHKVRISDEAVVAAVELSARYIPARQLPDKAVSLLDTACARVAICQSTTPAAISDLKDAINARKKELEAIERQSDIGRGQSQAHRGAATPRSPRSRRSSTSLTPKYAKREARSSTRSASCATAWPRREGQRPMPAPHRRLFRRRPATLPLRRRRRPIPGRLPTATVAAPPLHLRRQRPQTAMSASAAELRLGARRDERRKIA